MRKCRVFGTKCWNFSGTIRENLCVGREDISDQELSDALKLSGFESILKKFPNGLSFFVSEGGRELSGGQRQILALARAFISRPNVIILDEPTSAMDPRHENLFVKNLGNFTKDKTFIVVTHRKPILSIVDRILVIEEGKVILDGPSNEVLQNFPSLITIFWALFFMVAGILIWSVYFQLDKSIVAQGQVSPEGRALKVQNNYKGTIYNILIGVGEVVDTNDVLIELDTSQQIQKLGYLNTRLFSAKLEAARLLSVLNLPEGLETIKQDNDPYYQIQKNIYENEEQAFNIQIEALEKKIEAGKINLKHLNSRLPIVQKSTELAKKKLDLVSEMQSRGYEGEINVLAMEAEYNDALDKTVTIRNELQLIQNEVEQLFNEIQRITRERQITAAKNHYQLTQEIDEIKSEIEDIELFLSESSISSPISGVVSRVLFENVGQVIEPGTTLVEILPSDIQNVFYVEIPVASISEVTIGQKGQVSLANMDARSNAQLDAVLTKLDGDVTTADDGRKFYSGVVEFTDVNSEFLVPGVAGSVSLSLGERSVFMYIFDPIVDVVKNSLKE